MQEKASLSLPQATTLHEKYKINRTLGIGGFGIVYLAWDEENLRQVVIKECFPTDYAYRDDKGDILTRTEEEAALFNDCVLNAINEVTVLIRVRDTEGVVQVYDHFYDHNTFYYAMELVSGPSLWEQMLARRTEGVRWSGENVQTLLYQLLTTLEHLHSAHVYHSDIKPANILMAEETRPVLIDFGAARTKDIQHGGLVQITPGYTPPEFYPGMRRELGGWSDLYELGATFFEMLTEKTPEPGDQRLVRDRTLKLARTELVQDVPIAVLASIDKALDPDYRNRFSSARVWLDYLANPPSVVKMNSTSGQVLKKGKVSLKPTTASNKAKKQSLGCISMSIFALASIIALFLVAHYLIKVDWASMNLPPVIQEVLDKLPARSK